MRNDARYQCLRSICGRNVFEILLSATTEPGWNAPLALRRPNAPCGFLSTLAYLFSVILFYRLEIEQRRLSRSILELKVDIYIYLLIKSSFDIYQAHRHEALCPMSGTDLKFKRIGKTDIYGYQSSKYVNFQYLDELHSKFTAPGSKYTWRNTITWLAAVRTQVLHSRIPSSTQIKDEVFSCILKMSSHAFFHGATHDMQN